MNIKLFNNMCPVCNKRLKYYVFDLFTSKNDIIRCKKCSTELTNKRKGISQVIGYLTPFYMLMMILIMDNKYYNHKIVDYVNSIIDWENKINTTILILLLLIISYFLFFIIQRIIGEIIIKPSGRKNNKELDEILNEFADPLLFKVQSKIIVDKIVKTLNSFNNDEDEIWDIIENNFKQNIKSKKERRKKLSELIVDYGNRE